MYDVAISVGPQHKPISLFTIRAILKYGDTFRVFILTNRDNFEFYEKNSADLRPYIVLVDEDTVIPGVSIQSLREYIQGRGENPNRAGWYLQMFLTMSACRLPDISDHYLILDADTVFLRDVSFFDEQGRVLYVPETENHTPYFETYEKLLGRERSVPHSCISEHFMVDKKYMLELIDILLGDEKDWNRWPFIVLDHVETRHLSAAGFADYETYGNYVLSAHPESIRPRKLRHLRNSAKRFTSIPDKEDLYRLSLFYDYASFEVWNPKVRLRIIFEKGLSKLVYFVAGLMGKIPKD